MSFFDDIGDALSSVASNFAEPLLNAAPSIGGFLGKAIGGDSGAALGRTLGGLGGNLIRGVSGLGGAGGGGRSAPPQNQQPSYGGQVSPMNDSLMPTPSPNVAGMPGMMGWPQFQPSNPNSFWNQPMNQWGGMAGNMVSDYGSQMLNNNTSPLFQNTPFGQMPGMFGQAAGQWAGNRLAPNFPELGNALSSLGQGAGNYLGNQMSNYFGQNAMNMTPGQLPGMAGNMVSSGFNNMINPYVPNFMQNIMSQGGQQGGRGSSGGSPVVPSPAPKFYSQPYYAPGDAVGVD